MAVAWPTLADLEDQLQQDTPLVGQRQAVAERALAAATEWVAERCGLELTEVNGAGDTVATTIPYAVHQAILLYAAKFYRRKDSPDGVAGMGAGGDIIRTGRFDSDAESLLAPHTLFSV